MIPLLILIGVAAIVGVTTGLMSAYSGAEGTEKCYRRFGIPTILSLMSLFVLTLKFGWAGALGLTVMSLIGVYSMGYGVPDENDSGSKVGRFWYNIFNDHEKTNIATRSTIGVLKSVSFIALPIVSATWILYCIFSVLVTGSTLLWGAIVDNEGTFSMFNKECLWEEFYRQFADGFNATVYLGCIIML